MFRSASLRRRLPRPARVSAIVAMALLAACSADDRDLGTAPNLTDSATTVGTGPVSERATEPAQATESPQVTEPPQVAETTQAPASSTGAPTGFAAIEPVMTAFVDDHGLEGAGLVVVDREDGIVHEEYVGAFDRDRVSLIASSSKMITAGVLLRLADDGLLDLDAPVADAVDWGSGNPDITPAQLVSNSSGLVGLGPNPSYGPYICQFLPERELEECGITIFTTDTDDADVIAPDTEFRYGGGQWQVAGALAEAVSGRTWSELIDEIYVEPCGVDSLGFTNHWLAAGGFGYPDDFDPADLPPTDNPQMEGGAYITPPDYAELLLMHLRGGMCDGGRVLSEGSVARAHLDRVAETYTDAIRNPGYGFGWWVDRNTGVITDGGAYGSLPWLDLEHGYGAYLVIEASSDLGTQLFGQLQPVVAAAMVG